MQQIKQLKKSELKQLRINLHKEQFGICPILKQKVELDKCVIDHQHFNKNETLCENGNGLVRGCIDFRANTFEGKARNTWKRCGLHKIISFPNLLRNLADFLEQENLPLIHPTEAPKKKKLTKRCYNTLKKAYTGRAKFPPYPKSGHLIKKLDILFREYNITPQFYA